MPEKSNTKQAQPFLTIGIASYNYAAYLPQAFAQIKKQGFTDYELLYCDDGSTDDSVAVIKGFIKENPDICIRLISAENGGILANKNRIIDNACGKYLMICDADDYMQDGCLQALCDAAQAADADCVIGGFDEVDGKGNLLKRHIPPQNASKWLHTWHHAQIYKLQIVRDNGICFAQIPDDVYYLQQIHLHSQRVVFVHAALYTWVRHSDSTSTQAKDEWRPAALWNSLSGFIKTLREQAPPAERNALNYYLYKWYYFNICDLPTADRGVLKENLTAMQMQMEAAMPGHKQLGSLARTLHTGDTAFARCAVAGCWLVEKLGLAALPAYARSLQSSRRSKREGKGVKMPG